MWAKPKSPMHGNIVFPLKVDDDLLPEMRSFAYKLDKSLCLQASNLLDIRDGRGKKERKEGRNKDEG